MSSTINTPVTTLGSTLCGILRAPEDPLYSLVTAFEADKSPEKVDLGVGAYRDNDGQPYTLNVVRQAEKEHYLDLTRDHEYLPIAGISEFTLASQKLILGSKSEAVQEQRVCSFQTISGTGAIHLGGLLLAKFLPHPLPEIYISSPSWPIHDQVFTNVGFAVKHYPYFNAATRSLEFDGLISVLQNAAPRSIVVLHACAHNPTGVDPTHEQWEEIACVMRKNRLFAFFDCAYQGFATGSLSEDAFAVRLFAQQGFEMLIGQSFAKNMGLYGQRVGALHYVAPPGQEAQRTAEDVASQLSILQRSELSSPPIYGAKLAATILNNPDLFKEWQSELHTMSSRITQMRRALRAELERLQTPGEWSHITEQIGMFSFTGLSEAQVQELRTQWHVYMATTGRISVAGLNEHNVHYFAKAVHDVVSRLK